MNNNPSLPIFPRQLCILQFVLPKAQEDIAIPIAAFLSEKAAFEWAKHTAEKSDVPGYYAVVSIPFLPELNPELNATKETTDDTAPA